MITIESSFDTILRIKELKNNLLYLNSIDNNGLAVIDSLKFITPISITPVASIINKKNLNYKYSGDNAFYLEVIHFPEGITEIDKIISNKTYLPIIHLNLSMFPKQEISIQLGRLHSKFLELLKKNVIADPKFIELITNNTFGFLVSETLDNVQEHSTAENVYLFSQYWPANNSCEICIIDNGIGLYQSLKTAGRDVADDMDAIKKIIEKGLSSKAEFNRFIRGTGIKNMRAAITNKEIKGEFLIISGKAGFLHSANNGQFLFNFADYSWQGTILMMKLNRPLTNFNFYDYVK